MEFSFIEMFVRIRALHGLALRGLLSGKSVEII